jgi:hypothetical protein
MGASDAAVIKIDGISRFGDLICGNETYRINLEPAKAKVGPRGAKNRVRRQAKAIRARDYNMHYVTSAIVERYKDIRIEVPDIKQATASAAGSIYDHGAMVDWKAKQNRELLDYAIGKFCELLKYKAETACGKVDVVKVAGHQVELPNAIVSLAKASKQVRKRIKKTGAIHVPTGQNSLAKSRIRSYNQAVAV